jgi:hypothetical protein
VKNLLLFKPLHILLVFSLLDLYPGHFSNREQEVLLNLVILQEMPIPLTHIITNLLLIYKLLSSVNCLLPEKIQNLTIYRWFFFCIFSRIFHFHLICFYHEIKSCNRFLVYEETKDFIQFIGKNDEPFNFFFFVKISFGIYLKLKKKITLSLYKLKLNHFFFCQ